MPRPDICNGIWRCASTAMVARQRCNPTSTEQDPLPVWQARLMAQVASALTCLTSSTTEWRWEWHLEYGWLQRFLSKFSELFPVVSKIGLLLFRVYRENHAASRWGEVPALAVCLEPHLHPDPQTLCEFSSAFSYLEINFLSTSYWPYLKFDSCLPRLFSRYIYVQS